MNVALAAIALSEGRLFPSFDSSGFERAMDGPLRRIVVTGVGHWRGEGLALVETVPRRMSCEEDDMRTTS
jgi:3-oxoacyl-[acyl-carrier-protein] synthase II